MSNHVTVAEATDEQLREELIKRGFSIHPPEVIVSAWAEGDLDGLVDDDEDCADLTDEQVIEVKRLAFEEMSDGLAEVLGSRGNDYTSDRWYDIKNGIIASVRAATPKA